MANNSPRPENEDKLAAKAAKADPKAKGQALASGSRGLAKAGATKLAENNEQVQRAQETAQEIKKNAVRLKRMGSGLLPFIKAHLNPVVLLVELVVIVFLLGSVYLFGLTQVLGKNENAEGCSGAAGITAALPPSSVDQKAQTNAIGTWLMSTTFAFNGGKPLSKEQAAAMIGNWMEESGLNPAITQGARPGWCPNCTNEQILAAGASRGRAIGLAQWDGPRKIALVNFAQSKGKQWSDLGVQLEYLKSELDGGEGKLLANSAFVNGGDPGSLAETFNRVFERSADFSPKRAAHAQVAMNDITGGGTVNFDGTSTGGSCASAGGGAVTAGQLSGDLATFQQQYDARQMQLLGGNRRGRAPDDLQFMAGECVSWAGAYVKQFTKYKDFHNNWKTHWGNAKGWDEAANAAGVPVDQTPAVGAIAQHNRNAYGHVAVVTKVNPDGSFEIAEYNHSSRHAFGTRSFPAGSKEFDNFIHFER